MLLRIGDNSTGNHRARRPETELCVQGHPEAVLPSIQAKLLPMMIANFAVWPIAHLINFKFIPSQQR